MIKSVLDIAKKLILPGLAALGVAYGIYYSLAGQSPTPEAIGNTVPSEMHAGGRLAGSGVVEPVGQTVAVASPLPGIVEWVIGEDRLGTVVKKGEELFRLDARQLEAELEVRKAQLSSAQAELNRLKNMPRAEDLTPMEAKVREAQVNLDQKTDDYERGKLLYQRRAISDSELMNQRFDMEAARARLDSAKAELQKIRAGAWAEDLAVTQAAVQQAEAQVRQVEADLGRLVVKSQDDRTLLKIDVRPQEYVGAPPGKTLMMLGDLAALHVRVDIDENDAPRFNPGLKTTAHLRGQRDKGFSLEYVRTEPVIVPKQALTGEQTERLDVRVLQVIYRFNNSGDRKQVYVGQQLDIFMEAS